MKNSYTNKIFYIFYQNYDIYYFYIYLLLLDLHIAFISYLFQLTPITSAQHPTEPCAEVIALTSIGEDKRVYLFRYCWSFSCQCSSCVETIQLICVENWVTGFYVPLALAWKRLSINLYNLVIINMLSFNHRFVIFLLQTILESNQILTNVFKNVKV